MEAPGPVQKTKIPWGWVAGGLLGVLWLRGWWKTAPVGKLPYGARVEYAMNPIQGQTGQLASLSTYRLIANRRANMLYAPVTSEDAAKVLVFTVPQAGMVTRNVLVEGSKKYVEVATA